ncbi:CheB methylesterase domain-containing protein, partial [Klebsiella aerogenes]|uniref:CheB methylesterase domain-containing protein n=1 Tax=Klebsiella aerogenes TaxID=548 RepID=UPI0013D031C2
APGDKHMEIVRHGKGYAVRLTDAPPVNRHRPSVDVLFNSVAQLVGAHASAAILTAMGADGARGLLALRESGAFTLAQSEASCVVFGMPREAIAL